MKKAEKKSGFIPIERNEGNVQAIFSRCLTAAADSTSTSLYRYDGIKWTGNTVKLMDLYHLGEQTSGIIPGKPGKNCCKAKTTVVYYLGIMRGSADFPPGARNISGLAGNMMPPEE